LFIQGKKITKCLILNGTVAFRRNIVQEARRRRDTDTVVELRDWREKLGRDWFSEGDTPNANLTIASAQ